MDHPGVRMVRPLTVFGYDDAPHGHAEVELKDIQLTPKISLLEKAVAFKSHNHA